MKGIVIKTDGTVEDFDSDDLQAVLGGYLELIPVNFSSKATMFACEDGKRNELPFNKLATFLTGLYPQDYVVGDVILVGAPDDEGDEQSIPDDVAEAVKMIDVEATWDRYVVAVGAARR